MRERSWACFTRYSLVSTSCCQTRSASHVCHSAGVQPRRRTSSVKASTELTALTISRARSRLRFAFSTPRASTRCTTAPKLSRIPNEAFDGRLFVFQGALQPGEFIPPHTHSREDEVTFIVSGDLTFDLGGSVSVACSDRRLCVQAAWRIPLPLESRRFTSEGAGVAHTCPH